MTTADPRRIKGSAAHRESQVRRRAAWAAKKETANAERRSRYAQLSEEARKAHRDRNAAARAANPQKFRDYDKRRREAKLVKRGKALIGHCLRCGYDTYVGALEWHHVDPATKEAEPSWLLNQPDPIALSELSKCVLICVNCHREAHGGLWTPTQAMADEVRRVLSAAVAATLPA